MRGRVTVGVGLVLLVGALGAGCAHGGARGAHGTHEAVRREGIACEEVSLPSVCAKVEAQVFGRHAVCTAPTLCTTTKAVETMGEKLCDVMYDKTCREKGDCRDPFHDCVSHYSLASRSVVLSECTATPSESCKSGEVLCSCEVKVEPPGCLKCGCACEHPRR